MDIVKGQRGFLPRHFSEIPPFKQYAICDGIYSILFGKKLSPPQKSNEPLAQLILPLDIFR